MLARLCDYKHITDLLSTRPVKHENDHKRGIMLYTMLWLLVRRAVDHLKPIIIIIQILSACGHDLKMMKVGSN